MIRTYSELIKLKTFEERFNYLKLDSSIGKETFGYDRYLNQKFYSSLEWKRIRDLVITRDLGRDLGVEGYELYDKIYIHHINPISPSDLKYSNDYSNLLEPEFLICTSYNTHTAIHYGDSSYIEKISYVERKPNDTCPWKDRRTAW